MAGAVPSLGALGARIVILGPSNAGKSTLAVRIAAKTGLPAVHLDQLHHRPGSDWQPRPAAEFEALHAQAIAGERWVMEGNYSRLLPARLARATGLVLLDVSTATSLWRYVRRTLFEAERAGALAGGRETLKWLMIRHITFATPANRRKYASIYADADLPKLAVRSRAEIAALWRAWQLD